MLFAPRIPKEIHDPNPEPFAQPDKGDQRDVELACLNHLDVLEVDARVLGCLIERPAAGLAHGTEVLPKLSGLGEKARGRSVDPRGQIALGARHVGTVDMGGALKNQTCYENYGQLDTVRPNVRGTWMEFESRRPCSSIFSLSESAVATSATVRVYRRRVLILALLTLLWPLGSSRRAHAGPAILPSQTLPPVGNPLCSSNVVQCLDIDDFAGHIWGHIQVLPKAADRDTAAQLPFGATLGIFGRLVGSVSTHYSFWSANGDSHQQFGPIRLSMTGRLLPLFPLLTSGGDSAGGDTGNSHYVPPSGFRLGLSFEQEVRAGIFDGANSLGLLTNLATLRLIGSKTFGPLELTGSLGALYDWQGQFATAEAAAQLSLFLPFFNALRLYVEALGRGLPAYVQKGAQLPALDPAELIHRQAIIGGGLSFQPHARVDFGVSVQAGLGGLAPWTITVRVLTFSVGKTYQGRVATPIGELAVDATAAFAKWTAEKLQSIDPYLKHDCILYDDNHRPTVKLGELSADGAACMYQGLRVPIGPHFWHNRGDTRLCYDKATEDCFLTRPDRDSPWEPVHPLLVHGDCFAYLNGRPWMRTGTLIADKQGCETNGHVIPIGQALKPNQRYPDYYCYDKPDKAKKQTEKLWCLERPAQPQTDGQYLGRRFAGGIDRAKDSLDRTGDHVHQIIDEGASGIPLHATTPVQEAEEQGKEALHKIQNATDEDAKRVFLGALDAVKKWLHKPLREQAGDVAEEAGDVAASPTTWAAGAGAVVGRGGRALSVTGNVVSDVETLGQEGKQLEKAVEHLRPAHPPQFVPDHRPPKVGVDRSGVYTDAAGSAHPGGVPPHQTSVPLDTGASRGFRADQRRAVNQIGDTHGCADCGKTEPGTKPGRRPVGFGSTKDKGNFVIDHEPPVSQGGAGPYHGRPHCLSCSNKQGGRLSHEGQKSGP